MAIKANFDVLFAFHKLNEDGQARAVVIAERFDTLLNDLKRICPDSREFSICKTKLEEACFFAKKSMAMKPENLENVT